jgi:hypothetical protein
MQTDEAAGLVLVNWDYAGSPTVSIIYDEVAMALRFACSVDNVPVPGYYGSGLHYVGETWLGTFRHDYQPENIANDILEISSNCELAPKVMWYTGETYDQYTGRIAAGGARPGRVIFNPENPGSNGRNAPRNHVNDPLGNAGVLANDTAFINSNWSQVNRPSNNNLAKYRYLHSEVRRNGTVPRVYHENAIRNVRNGRTGGRHPFTRQAWTANVDASVRRLR